ncbi:MAG: sodium:proton antiporter, partial [Bacteroidales bacterium]|nr:sodium:proton antiporter [Bacteroidales bacterium]
MIIVFVTGYLMIAFEHPLRVNKAATALLLAVVMWTLFAFCNPAELPDYSPVQSWLAEHPDGSFI